MLPLSQHQIWIGFDNERFEIWFQIWFLIKKNLFSSQPPSCHTLFSFSCVWQKGSFHYGKSDEDLIYPENNLVRASNIFWVLVLWEGATTHARVQTLSDSSNPIHFHVKIKGFIFFCARKREIRKRSSWWWVEAWHIMAWERGEPSPLWVSETLKP